MDRLESLKRIVAWHQGVQNYMSIKPYEEGNYLLGVTCWDDGEDGCYIPVITGDITLHCICVGDIPSGTPVMIVDGEER